MRVYETRYESISLCETCHEKPDNPYYSNGTCSNCGSTSKHTIVDMYKQVIKIERVVPFYAFWVSEKLKYKITRINN